MSRWKPYPEYADSGVEWLGEVPVGWEVAPVKRAARLRYGLGQPPPSRDDGVPFVRATDFHRGLLCWDGMLRVDPFSASSCKDARLGTGDIIVVRSGAYTGDSLLVPAELDGAIAGYDLVLTPVVAAAEFLAWQLLSQEFYDVQVGFSRARAAQPHLNAEELGEMLITLPPLPEQRAIAAFLARETARIDALVAKKQRLIELLEEKRQALISHALTKGLDPNAPMKDSGVEWLGEVPEHWEVRELRRLAREGTAITYGIVQAGPDVEGGVPYIRTSDMAGDQLPPSGYPRTSEEIDRAYSRSKVEAGDIVVSIRASVGKALPVPNCLHGANLTQGTARFSPGESIDGRFALRAISAPLAQQRLEALAKGATFSEITLEMLRRFAVAVPPLSEQRAIADYLDRETGKLDALASKVREAIERLQEYRTALISAAVTGKIDVRGEAAAEADAPDPATTEE